MWLNAKIKARYGLQVFINCLKQQIHTNINQYGL